MPSFLCSSRGQAVGLPKLIALTALAVLLSLLAYAGHKQGTPGSSSIQQAVQLSGRSKQLAASADPQQQKRAYQRWLDTFKAADAAYQDYCLSVLLNSTSYPEKGGQHSQDIFLFQNLYKYWPVTGRKGFYVESGANDALYLSTSLFFDKCLGWDGLCVEPQEKFHQALREKRSCKLVPQCISAKKENMTMSGEDATARVSAAGGSGPRISCSPLKDLLAEYAGSADQVVDLWILDVEGYEMQVLKGTNFSEVAVDALIIEDLLMFPKPDVLDILLAQKGYLKYQELSLDSVFVRRGHPAAMDTRPIWYPPRFWEEVEQQKQFVQAQMCGFLRGQWEASARG